MKAAITNNPKNRGAIFSLEALFSFAATLVICLAFVSALNAQSRHSARELKNFELEEKALFVADFMLKNSSEQNPLLGASTYDAEKRRINPNELQLSTLRQAKSIKIGDLFVKSVHVQTNLSDETIFLQEKPASDCLVVKRFALVDETKAIITVATCRER